LPLVTSLGLLRHHPSPSERQLASLDFPSHQRSTSLRYLVKAANLFTIPILRSVSIHHGAAFLGLDQNQTFYLSRKSPSTRFQPYHHLAMMTPFDRALRVCMGLPIARREVVGMPLFRTDRIHRNEPSCATSRHAAFYCLLSLS